MKIINKMQHFLRICFRSCFIILSAVIFVLFSISLSFAGNVTFVKEYTYQASELDSKASCRTISLEMVKRLLLEELGTYLISETEVKDFKLTKEQIKTYSAGIVGAEIIEDKWDGKTYWLKAKVSADPKEVRKSLKKIVDDKFQAKQLEETRKKAEELTKEVARLNTELAKATNKQPSKKVQKEYKAAIQGLTAIEWANKGLKAYSENKWDDARDAGTKAIELNANIAEAYVIRSLAYSNLGDYQQAIKDSNKAIELKPNYEAYASRGLAYEYLGNYQQAVHDYSKAIDFDPDIAETYIGRGLAYIMISNYVQAIKDFTKAIELKPDKVLAYESRGFAYSILGNYLQAIKDFTKIIELKPDDVRAYVDRGLAYSKIGNYQQALKGCNKAVELEPDYASAYTTRGIIYRELGNYQQAIKDLRIAARLGNKDAQDTLLKMGERW